MRLDSIISFTRECRSGAPEWRDGIRARRLTKAAAAISALAVGLALGGYSPVSAAAPRVYYLSPAGNDANAGISTAAPWRTLAKANQAALNPGDKVLLARGGSWTGVVLPSGSGTASAPITVGAYGSGNLPKITGGANGDCVRVLGNYITVDSLSATSCGYDGFNLFGDHDAITHSQAFNLKVGIHISSGSAYGSLEYNTLTNINLMQINTPGTNCGTPSASHCNDDSGATAFLINGNDNDFGDNTVTGSNAFSYDYGRDGSAFEVYDGNNNVFHNNISGNNLVLSELGRSSTGSANGNVFRANAVTANCGVNCTNAGGVTLRGTGSSYGPNLSTTIDHNTFDLVGRNTQAITCYLNCPASTAITGNTVTVAARALWVDGSGWTLSGNVIYGPTLAQAGATKQVVPAGTFIVW